MRLRDPLLLIVLLLGVFTVAVLQVMAGWLVGTTEGIGSDVRALPAPPRAVPSSELTALEIPEGAPADDIRRLLLELDVLVDASSFDTLLAFSGVGTELQAGRYEIPQSLAASEVIRRLRVGGVTTELVRFPEGLRVEEVGALLADAGIVTLAEWTAATQSPIRHPVLLGRPEDADLTGYLLPASYPFRDTTTAEDAIVAMLDAFAEQVTPQLIAQAEDKGLTVHDLVTLAAIVEREAALREEQPLIASVFLNRLDQEIPLSADPTVQFAIATPASVEEFGWWKAELEQTDLSVDSQYNTYRNLGLPPGPIANPGIAAIEAVAQPAEGNFLFFVAAPECDGSHRFAADYSDHVANVGALRLSGCGVSQ